MRRRFCPNRIFEGLTSQNRYTCLKFSSKWKHSALFMKIVQVIFSGHAQHVLAKSHFWASKLSKSSHWPEILFKTGKQYAFHKNCTERFFQVIRSTFWPNRVCERQSFQNRHTGRTFCPKRENSALFMKIVQKALFRSCAARFGQIAFLSVKVVKIVTLAWNSRQNGKRVRFSWKLYKTLFSGHAQHVLAKSNWWASNFSKSLHLSQILFKTGKQCAFHENCRSCAARFGQIAFLNIKVVNSSHWPEILFKTAKQCAFHENCTKRSFQVMRSTFSPNQICERQSCQNRHTDLKVSPKRENSALFMKIVQNPFFWVMRSTIWPNRIFYCQSSQNRETRLKVSSKRKNSALSMKIGQNALFRSCATRFGQIAFLSVKVLKIVTLAVNFLQKGKTVRFSWKLYKTLVSGHAQEVLPKSHFWGSNFSKSLHLSQILLNTGKQCAFHENCTKRSFQVMRSSFCPNQICERQSSQNRHTGLIFSPKRENSALFMKIKQNPLFRSWAARFGQIAFLSVKVVKFVTLASNSLQNGKTVRFSLNLYKTLFSGHTQHVLAKSYF